MEATISITLRRDYGITVSRQVTVTTSRYSKRPVSDFKKDVRKRTAEALNSVLGPVEPKSEG